MRSLLKFVLVIVLFSVLVSAEDLEVQILPYCDHSLFNECNKVQGNINNYSIHGSLGNPQTIQFDYQSNEISCYDKTDVDIAYYDEVNNIWVHLNSTVVSQGGNTYRISAQTNYLGYIAIVGNDECVLSDCNYGAYGLNPFSGLVGVSAEIDISFCGLVPKCNAVADGVCDVNCVPGIDPDCGECTPAGNNCCLPSDDGICDTDCFDNVDPDCCGSDECCLYDISGSAEEVVNENEIDLNATPSSCGSNEGSDWAFCQTTANIRDLSDIFGHTGASCMYECSIRGYPSWGMWSWDGETESDCWCGDGVVFSDNPSGIYGDPPNVACTFRGGTCSGGYRPGLESSIGCCYPAKDGYCDANCNEGLDPDCCNNIADGNNTEGCCVLEDGVDRSNTMGCDNVCDTDCLVGVDPDCWGGCDYSASTSDSGSFEDEDPNEARDPFTGLTDEEAQREQGERDTAAAEAEAEAEAENEASKDAADAEADGSKDGGYGD